MHSFHLLYTYLSFASALLPSELQFERYNNCGCFRSDQCPITHNTVCDDQNNNLHGIYLQNSASSQFPEKCSKWFKGFMTHFVVPDNGTLNIKLYFSNTLFNLLNSDNIFELQLRYQSQCRHADSNSSFYFLDLNHSVEYITVKGTETDSCLKMTEVSFSYVFSGCYQLYVNEVKNSGISNGCMSKPFSVVSSYKKTPLNQLLPNFSHFYTSQRQVLSTSYVFGNFSHGLNHPYSTFISLKSQIDSSLENCAGSGSLTAKYVLVDRGECCDANRYHPGESYPRKMSTCPCKWFDDDKLECQFRGIKNGNYCAVIEFIDPRCEKSTVWIENNRDCTWESPFVVEGQVQSNMTVIAHIPNKPNSFYIILVLLCLSIILGTLGISYLILHVFNIKKKSQMNTLEEKMVLETSSPSIEGILLLYPRECKEFMEAMEQFRTILKESCLCMVYDPWAEEIIDKVAESIETWSLPLIGNENIKIIIILSELSKMIEEALIDDKHSFAYRHPKALDKVFGQSLKALNEYFAIRTDSYQRVFVVRLDEKPINLSFHFNCATCYFLPHKLQDLVNDLKNESVELNTENTKRLKTVIKKYLSYKQRNGSYALELIKVNNNHEIVKI